MHANEEYGPCRGARDHHVLPLLSGRDRSVGLDDGPVPDPPIVLARINELQRAAAANRIGRPRRAAAITHAGYHLAIRAAGARLQQT